MVNRAGRVKDRSFKNINVEKFTCSCLFGAAAKGTTGNQFCVNSIEKRGGWGRGAWQKRV